MQSFLKSVYKDLDTVIHNLARQDFDEAVNDILYIKGQIRDIVNAGVFYDRNPSSASPLL